MLHFFYFEAFVAVDVQEFVLKVVQAFLAAVHEAWLGLDRSLRQRKPMQPVWRDRLPLSCLEYGRL